MHGGFLVTGKDKMSKSTGEFLTLDLVKDKGFDPMCYRLFCLSGTYRNELAWSWDAIQNSANTLNKMKNAVGEMRLACEDLSNDGSVGVSAAGEEFVTQFDEAVFNDLALPRALSVAHAVISSDLPAQEKLKLLEQFDQVLGLGIETWQPEAVEVPEEVQKLVLDREAAREAKNWAEADALRDKIGDLGYTIEDSKEGTKVKLR
jgi:cysteinyl-tRNA synthetase